MRLKAVQIGNGRSETMKRFPGVGGLVRGFWVGQKLTSLATPITVSSLDYDRQGRMIMLRAVDNEGKAWRKWDESRDAADDSVPMGRECDAIAFPADECVLFFDDEQVAPKGK